MSSLKYTKVENKFSINIRDQYSLIYQKLHDLSDYYYKEKAVQQAQDMFDQIMNYQTLSETNSKCNGVYTMSFLTNYVDTLMSIIIEQCDKYTKTLDTKYSDNIEMYQYLLFKIVECSNFQLYLHPDQLEINNRQKLSAQIQSSQDITLIHGGCGPYHAIYYIYNPQDNSITICNAGLGVDRDNILSDGNKDCCFGAVKYTLDNQKMTEDNFKTFIKDGVIQSCNNTTEYNNFIKSLKKVTHQTQILPTLNQKSGNCVEKGLRIAMICVLLNYQLSHLKQDLTDQEKKILFSTEAPDFFFTILKHYVQKKHYIHKIDQCGKDKLEELKNKFKQLDNKSSEHNILIHDIIKIPYKIKKNKNKSHSIVLDNNADELHIENDIINPNPFIKTAYEHMTEQLNHVNKNKENTKTIFEKNIKSYNDAIILFHAYKQDTIDSFTSYLEAKYNKVQTCNLLDDTSIKYVNLLGADNNEFNKLNPGSATGNIEDIIKKYKEYQVIWNNHELLQRTINVFQERLKCTQTHTKEKIENIILAIKSRINQLSLNKENQSNFY